MKNKSLPITSIIHSSIKALSLPKMCEKSLHPTAASNQPILYTLANENKTETDLALLIDHQNDH